jgi:hypothetical protein
MKTTDQITKSLRSVFGVPVVYNPRDEEWSFNTCGGSFTAAELFRACEAIGCSHEQLLWNPDLDYSGCYYEGENPEQLIIIKVKR